MMPTQKKFRRAKPLSSPESALPSHPAEDRNLMGDLPGDDRVEYYYEERIANWLGVARKRIVALRRRALHEGRDWIVRGWQVCFTHSGIERLRTHFSDLGLHPNLETDSADKVAAEEPAPPAGPLERKTLRVVRLFPNRRLLWASPGDTPAAAGAAGLLVRVKDNTNFMAGMTFKAVHHSRSGWQFVGRLPRSKGKW